MKMYRRRSRLSPKASMLVGVIFGIVGLCMLVGGLFWLVNERDFLERAEIIDAEITRIYTSVDSDGDRSHSVYVEYVYRGVSYSERLSEYSSSMTEGKEIQLYIDPENPTRIRYTNMAYFGPVFLMSMGVLFLTMGVIFTWFFAKKVKMQRENSYSENESGNIGHTNDGKTCIYAEIYDCTLDNTYEGEKKPWRLHCRYVDEQQREHYYSSAPMWEDGRKYIGRMVPVYVQDEEHYQVYTEALSEKS